MTYVEGGFKMIYFRSDYSLGAHPKVMEALMETNMEHTDGYAEDRFSFETADMIREMIGRPDAHIHFLVGGTPTNTITIAAALRPYEGAISAASGHILFSAAVASFQTRAVFKSRPSFLFSIEVTS